MANWFESYASIMELNVVCTGPLYRLIPTILTFFLKWLNTTVEPNGAQYDDSTSEWTVHVQDIKQGTSRVVKCRHLVQATGLSLVAFIADDHVGA